MDERPPPLAHPPAPESGTLGPGRLVNALAWCAGLLSGAGVVAWGPTAGFQHYWMLVPPVLALQSAWSWARRLAASLLAVASYVLLEAVDPLWSLSADLAAVVFRVNAVAGLLLLVVSAWVGGGQFQAMQVRLKRSASTDSLTGLLNRRSWIDSAQTQLLRARRPGRRGGLGVLIIGVDHLRHINDLHGHAAGDLVLGAVAVVLQRGLRERDLMARWCGDQFIAMLTGGELQALRMVGERLRALVQAASVRAPGNGELMPLSVSMGLAHLGEGETLDAAIARADKALDEAKQTGRNRVVMARS